MLLRLLAATALKSVSSGIARRRTSIIILSTPAQKAKPGEKYFNIQNAKLAIKTWRACRLKQSATGCSSCKNNKPASRRRRSRANTLEATWARTAAAPAPAAAPWLALRLLPFCVTEIVKKKMKKKKQKQKRKNSIQEGKESARKKKLVTFSWFVCRLPNQSSDNNNSPGTRGRRERNR